VTGATGAQGATGAAGSNGSDGEKGAPGPTGGAGENGKNGEDGVTGAAGSTGATGAEGPTGKEGPAGSTGATGSEGPTGNEGPAGPTHVASGIVFTPPFGEPAILIEPNFSPGVNVTVGSTGPGEWVLEATGLGAGCPQPALTSAFNGAAGFTVGTDGSGCSPGVRERVVVQTSDRQNHEWEFLWVGI
jgi:hypothetical protein